jgi:large subunit ribosomal protein L24
MKSIKPRKQKKELFNAPLHKKRKWLAAHLEENLLLKYDKRGIPVVKGDTVKVMRGSYRGHEDKISKVNIKKRYVEIEGLTIIKADGKKIAKPLNPSNLLITKLNLTDKWRRGKLERGLSEETRKEIEKEAEEQIMELEEQEKRKIEEEKEEEEIKEEIETEELTEEPEEKLKPKTEKKIDKPQVKQKKENPLEKPVEKPKKTVEKKKVPVKKTTKKTPAKTSKKKEEK